MTSCSKSDRITALFPIETKVRDLDGRLLLSAELANAGISCFLGSKSAIRQQSSSFFRPVVFDKGLNADPAQYKWLWQVDGRLIDLNEEGGIFSRHLLERCLLGRYAPEVVTDVDLFFMWGEIQHEYIWNKRQMIPPADFILSGHPRFDFLHGDYSRYYDPAVNRLREDHGPFILINTNFSAATHFVRHNNGGSGQLTQTSEESRATHLYAKKIQARFLKAIARITSEFRDLKVVVRPHPGEDHEFYIDALSGIRNASVHFHGNVHEWIIAAEMVMHHDCSTGLESFIAGKPTISYCFDDPVKSAQKLPMELSEMVTDEDKLMQLIDRFSREVIDKTDPLYRAKQKRLKRWINNVDFRASELVTQTVLAKESVLLAERPRQGLSGANANDLSASSSPGHTSVSLPQKMLHLIKHRFGSGDPTQHRRILFAEKKMPGISIDEMNEKLNRLRPLNPKFDRLVCEQVCQNGFLIRC